jgi:hypothetical protein
MRTKKLVLGGPWLAVALLAVLEFHSHAGQGSGGKFDKLSAEDRALFAARFEKEIWPLLERGGKDGCVGCHNGTRVTALRFTGTASKDFPMLVGEGFMLKGDPGSLLERIVDKDPKRRMPPDKQPRWTETEVKLLRAFVNDLDAKNKL